MGAAQRVPLPARQAALHSSWGHRTAQGCTGAGLGPCTCSPLTCASTRPRAPHAPAHNAAHGAHPARTHKQHHSHAHTCACVHARAAAAPSLAHPQAAHAAATAAAGRRLLQCTPTPAVTAYAAARTPRQQLPDSVAANNTFSLEQVQVVLAFEAAFDLATACGGPTYSCLLAVNNSGVVASGSARQLDTAGKLFQVRAWLQAWKRAAGSGRARLATNVHRTCTHTHARTNTRLRAGGCQRAKRWRVWHPDPAADLHGCGWAGGHAARDCGLGCANGGLWAARVAYPVCRGHRIGRHKAKAVLPARKRHVLQGRAARPRPTPRAPLARARLPPRRSR